MTCIAKFPISMGCGADKVIIPKGTKGHIIAVSNSTKILEQFPNLEEKVDGWFYLCNFLSYVDEILCTLKQIDLQ